MKDNNHTILMEDRYFIQEIKQLITHAPKKEYVAINSAMEKAYWQMGKLILERLIQISNPTAPEASILQVVTQTTCFRPISL